MDPAAGGNVGYSPRSTIPYWKEMRRCGVSNIDAVHRRRAGEYSPLRGTSPSSSPRGSNAEPHNNMSAIQNRRLADLNNMIDSTCHRGTGEFSPRTSSSSGYQVEERAGKAGYAPQDWQEMRQMAVSDIDRTCRRGTGAFSPQRSSDTSVAAIARPSSDTSVAAIARPSCSSPGKTAPTNFCWQEASLSRETFRKTPSRADVEEAEMREAVAKAWARVPLIRPSRADVEEAEMREAVAKALLRGRSPSQAKWQRSQSPAGSPRLSPRQCGPSKTGPGEMPNSNQELARSVSSHSLKSTFASRARSVSDAGAGRGDSEAQPPSAHLQQPAGLRMLHSAPSTQSALSRSSSRSSLSGSVERRSVGAILAEARTSSSHRRRTESAEQTPRSAAVTAKPCVGDMINAASNSLRPRLRTPSPGLSRDQKLPGNIVRRAKQSARASSPAAGHPVGWFSTSFAQAAAKPPPRCKSSVASGINPLQSIPIPRCLGSLGDPNPCDAASTCKLRLDSFGKAAPFSDGASDSSTITPSSERKWSNYSSLS